MARRNAPARTTAPSFVYARGPALTPPPLVAATALHARLWLRRLVNLPLLTGLLMLGVVVVAAVVGVARLDPGTPRAILDAFDAFAVPVVAMVALGLGTTALRRDADHGALDAFLIRPHAQTALPIGRWLATAALVAGFAWLLLALTGISAALWVHPIAGDRLLILALGLPLGAAAYAAVFFAFGAWSRAAAALSLGWWLVIDLGLSRVAELPAYLAVRPALVEILGFDSDVGLFTEGGAVFWAAVARLVVVIAAAVFAACWRLRGDAPG
jgi:hypothetical protein